MRRRDGSRSWHDLASKRYVLQVLQGAWMVLLEDAYICFRPCDAAEACVHLLTACVLTHVCCRRCNRHQLPAPIRGDCPRPVRGPPSPGRLQGLRSKPEAQE